jgi:vacuolar protein sorting-associated protein 72
MPLTMSDHEDENRPSTSSGGSDDDSEDSAPVELLVTGRERRKTAGNRYDRNWILEETANEEEPDEVTLLFAEGDDEEDEEFRSEVSDADDMSSSDDDDQGPNAGPDDLDGEKELQKQAKDERAKKRKADLALTSTAALRKRPKIDPTQPKPLVKKPAKKKERVTWLPNEDRSAARSSLRKQTIAHREETLARLKISEAQAKKMKVVKERRDREKAKNAPKAMTQADRLAEAERIERRNAKSLNRWETLEKKRIEEQAAKLAALKDRKLEGPFISLWSGKAFWRGPKLVQVYKDFADDNPGEPKKRGRKPKGYHEQMAALRAAGDSVPVSAHQSPGPSAVPQLSNQQAPPASTEKSTQANPIFATPQGPANSLLSGIHEYASMQDDDNGANNTVVAARNATEAKDSKTANDQPVADAPTPDERQPVIPGREQDDDAPKSEVPVIDPPHSNMLQNDAMATPTPALSGIIDPNSVEPQPLPPPVVPIEEGYTTKNMVILNKFEDLSDTGRKDYRLFYNTRKSTKPVRHAAELCPITMHPAKYKDPKTGIPYANVFAYKVLQELKDHKFIWSSMLGCYVGRGGAPVARGVPEGFSAS